MDVFDKCQPSDDLTKLHNFARKLRQEDPYPYFIPFNKKAGKSYYRDLPLKMFGSNDYLGLSTDQRVLDAYCKAANEFGTGCTRSRFLNGTNTLHVDLEKRLAAFFGKDDALAFR